MSNELTPSEAIQPDAVLPPTGGIRYLWAVTSGSYSDYRVLAVCEDEQLAQEMLGMKSGWSRPDSVERLPFYPAGARPAPILHVTLMLDIYDDGSTGNAREMIDHHYDWDDEGAYPERPTVRFVRAPIHQDKGGRLEVRGRNLDAVRQCFADNLARIRVQAETTGRARG